MIHLDTSFLVDLLRESRRRSEGPARRRLVELADEELGASVHVLCELFAGAELSRRPAQERRAVAVLTTAVEVVPPAPGFAQTYGRLLADLQRSGETIATMDLLIATTAILAEAPLVTRNVRHFERIRDLEILTY